MQSATKLLAAVTLIAVTACSGKQSSSTGTRSSRDLITRAQIEQLNATDGYDIVQRLRSDVLRPRGATSIRSGPEMAVVYVDGVRRGTPDVLRQIRANEIEEIRFVSGTDATTRYGTDHGGGAIEVKTRSGR